MWKSFSCVSVAIIATLGAFTAVAYAAGSGTTVDKTIADSNGDNRLEFGPGEPYKVREDLVKKPKFVFAPPKELFRPILQLSDFQLADEESPARLEHFDTTIPGVFGAYRPQESLQSQTVDAAVRQLNRVRSPITGKSGALAIVTGDNADNSHENETEQYITLLDGGAVNPNSGNPSFDPDPGLLGIVCIPIFYPTDTYQGVRGNGKWYEPDSSSPGQAGDPDGPGYSPDEATNFNHPDIQRHIASRDFQGLLDKAQQPFIAMGLNVPWLTVLGDHDNLVQGNVASTNFIENLATGCKKIKGLVGDGLKTVQPDPKRHIATHQEWIAKHLQSPATPGPAGHGFSAAQPDIGYYSVKKRELRLIGLDSVNQAGGAAGTVDDTQFDWLNQELDKADRKGEKVIVYSHHSLVTMDNPAGLTSNHCGLATSSSLCNTLGNESLEELYYKHNSVIAHVAGHEHNNRIAPRKEQGSSGSFWEIVLASESDWPQQNGMLEVLDNGNGTFSIFRTIIDHAAVPDIGNSPDLNDPLALASISREISLNDPQGDTGEDGTFDAKGKLLDRNVDLIIN